MATESFNKKFKITHTAFEKISKNPKTLYATNRDLEKEDRKVIRLLSKEKR